MAETEVVPIDMPDSNGEMTWQAKNYTQYSSYFMKITCLKYLIGKWHIQLLNHSDLRLYRTQPTMSYWLMGMTW
ncbi:hypothetical protein CEX29_23905 [Salmonella enterica]|nr:hypothetical protein [Salmonella enterica]